MVMVQRTPRDAQQSEAFIAPRDFIAGVSTDFLIRGYVLADTEPRYRVRADGRVELGPGGTTVPDVGFERLSANVLGLLDGDTLSVTSGRIDLSGAPLRWTVGVAITAAQYEITRDADTTNQLHFNVPAGASFEWSVNDIAEVQLNATTFGPSTNDGNALGTATLSWADLFFATGAVINFGNGNVTFTHVSGSIGFVGSFEIGGLAFGAGAARNLGLANTAATLGAAVANLAQLACIDIAAGDARLQIQTELGGVISIGNDTIRAALPAAAAATNISLQADNDFQQDTSALRHKEQIEALTNWREILTGLQPREFNWKAGVGVSGLRLPGGRHDLGFIAEEAYAVDPRLASWGADSEIASVRYQLIVSPLVAGWQDHETRIKALERQVLLMR